MHDFPPETDTATGSLHTLILAQAVISKEDEMIVHEKMSRAQDARLFYVSITLSLYWFLLRNGVADVSSTSSTFSSETLPAA